MPVCVEGKHLVCALLLGILPGYPLFLFLFFLMKMYNQCLISVLNNIIVLVHW